MIEKKDFFSIYFNQRIPMRCDINDFCFKAFVLISTSLRDATLKNRMGDLVSIDAPLRDAMRLFYLKKLSLVCFNQRIFMGCDGHH